MKKTISKKTWVILIIFVFLGASVLFAGGQKEKTKVDPDIERIEKALKKTKGNKKKVFANARGVAHKGSGTFSLVFPDVCKSPAPAGPIPMPYPSIAMSSDTAKGAKKVKADQATAIAKKSDYTKSESDEVSRRMTKLQRDYKKIIAKRDLTAKEKTTFKKELQTCLDKSRFLAQTMDKYVEEIEKLLQQAKKQ
jgi:hypothetical protein